MVFYPISVANCVSCFKASDESIYDRLHRSKGSKDEQDSKLEQLREQQLVEYTFKVSEHLWSIVCKITVAF